MAIVSSALQTVWIQMRPNKRDNMLLKLCSDLAGAFVHLEYVLLQVRTINVYKGGHMCVPMRVYVYMRVSTCTQLSENAMGKYSMAFTL